MSTSVMFLIIFPILWFGRTSCQTTLELIPPEATTSAVATDRQNQTDSLPTEPKNCTTAKGGLKGICVERFKCDYGTPAVDFTLYAFKNYKKTCSTESVCCPFESILQSLQSSNTGQSNQHEYDKDFDAD